MSSSKRLSVMATSSVLLSARTRKLLALEFLMTTTVPSDRVAPEIWHQRSHSEAVLRPDRATLENTSHEDGVGFIDATQSVVGTVIT